MKYFFLKIKKYRPLEYSRSNGLTIIEVLIYTSLLSMLLSGFLSYAWIIQTGDIRLIHKINDAYVTP
ncbi:MAG: hypothetical protein A3B11_01385 [Candidatus Taylorbacteria bacterium RIFCSPLOWO2_01_FULL_44_26]|uniref:Uncharacterized protein n=2 Tax=Candidatus Tayloriibacteriota TaxID=1817919 RepID=A0A1G2MMA9_9BACT|nr:MAG: hypothetical protein A3D50_01165 [Candidatus Taylorbacteria bacterium RIFCSPHIGHO2_02_FULL_44_12]OHA30967.1 MAG: hypothetical protein A3B11_01385 [Candidatus Taylorbacteria bacterium RIFCSPLOWO2_01_FULL_44_26]